MMGPEEISRKTKGRVEPRSTQANKHLAPLKPTGHSRQKFDQFLKVVVLASTSVGSVATMVVDRALVIVRTLTLLLGSLLKTRLSQTMCLIATSVVSLTCTGRFGPVHWCRWYPWSHREFSVKVMCPCSLGYHEAHLLPLRFLRIPHPKPMYT